MIGDIYTRQKCFLCDGRLVHDPKRAGCYCLEHPQVCATGDFILKFKEVRQESKSYDVLIRKLNMLRYQVDKDAYDPRDYQADKPLAFQRQIMDYLAEKETQDLKTIGNIRHYCRVAAGYFGDQNVKQVKKRHLVLFLKSLDVAKKTQANYLSNLRAFYTWMVDEELLFHHQVPDFPKVDFDLAWRKVTDWETQDAILEKIREMTWSVNPKIWLGIDMLRTYANIRSGDLLRLTEADFDMVSGILMIWAPTKRRGERKTIRLVDDHRELIAEMKQRFPAVPMVKFFRHHGGVQSVRPGQPWGNKYLYKWWIKACEALGIEGLDLYGGTRHTTTTELAKRYGREAAMDANENRTNKAFDRYCQMQGERAYEMARRVKQNLPTNFLPKKKRLEKS